MIRVQFVPTLELRGCVAFHAGADIEVVCGERVRRLKPFTPLTVDQLHRRTNPVSIRLLVLPHL